MIPRRARVYSIVLVLLLLLQALGASRVWATTFPDKTFENTILIGTTVSLSGRYGFEGQQALCGMKAAVDWINSNGGIEFLGKTWYVKLVYNDDESSPEKARQYFQEYISNGITLFIAPYSESLASEIAPLVEKQGGVLMLYGPSSDRLARLYSSTIQVSSPVSVKYNQLFRIVKEAGGTDVVIISDGSAYAANSVKAVINVATSMGLKVERINYIKEGDVLNALNEPPGNYSLLLILSDSLDMFKKIADEAYKSNSSFKLVATDVIASFPHFYLELGPSKAENIVGVSEWEEADLYSEEKARQIPNADWYGPNSTKAWLEYYTKYCKTGVPGSVAAAASAAVLALANYIYWAGSLDPAAIKAKAKDIYMITFYGPIQVDEKAYQTRHIPLLTQWIEGYKEIVYPKKFATAELVYPAPNWIKTPPTTGTETTPLGGGSMLPIAGIAVIVVIGIVVYFIVRSRR